ncbi:hypothetical protein ATL39_0064 [Sinobaca qinghaiensis]|uniref:Uncharacterized protein n=1 Tax=Sinobaca qinghaiensis TaxID=342944 RepID=A0A419VTW6_9BACL|nr:hypothetical protein [Sinobaca qinghaiensis]RKD84131.1 hypothetical protein ATL39_0064 [Sinobaca qinghaiensis]
MHQGSFRIRSLYISDDLISIIKNHQKETFSNSFSATAIRLICKGLEQEIKEKKEIRK